MATNARLLTELGLSTPTRLSTSWVEHAKHYVEMISGRLGLGGGDLVVELASNDGYLLQHFVNREIPCLGIDPAALKPPMRPRVTPKRRGVLFFARSWDRDVFAGRGLNPELAQCSISYNAKCGTLRGMHYQAAPHQEAKLVRCTSGAIFDVALDLRQGSATFAGSFGAKLSAENGIALYVPEGCAHGFLTLADSTEVQYQISVPYAPSGFALFG